MIVVSKDKLSSITIEKLGSIRQIDSEGSYLISSDPYVRSFYNYWGAGITDDIFKAYRFTAKEIIGSSLNDDVYKIIDISTPSKIEPEPLQWNFTITYVSKKGEHQRRTIVAFTEQEAIEKIEDFGEMIFSIKEA